MTTLTYFQNTKKMKSQIKHIASNLLQFQNWKNKFVKQEWKLWNLFICTGYEVHIFRLLQTFVFDDCIFETYSWYRIFLFYNSSKMQTYSDKVSSFEETTFLLSPHLKLIVDLYFLSKKKIKRNMNKRQVWKPIHF